jgi:hypothetical protein
MGVIGAPSDAVTLSVYQGGTVGDDGTLLTSSVVPGSTMSNFGPVDFPLDDEVLLLPSTTYWFTFTRTGANNPNDWYQPEVTFNDEDTNATFYLKDDIGNWTLGSNSVQHQLGLSYEYYGHGLIVFIPGGPIVFPISRHDFIHVAESVTVVPDRQVSVHEDVTMVDDPGQPNIPGYTFFVSINDSITVADVISTKPRVYRDAASTNRYWVGNSGDWSDGYAHWSDSSGGLPGCLPPTGIFQSVFVGPSGADNPVYFDANSFTIDAQVVNLDVDTIVQTLDCTGMSHTATLASLSGTHTFMVLAEGNPNTRSIIFHPKFTLDNSINWSAAIAFSNVLNFNPNGCDLTLYTGNLGAFVPGNFAGEGATPTFNLTGDLNAPLASFGFSGSISGSSFASYLSHFNTNNHTITVNTVYMGGSSGQPPSSMTMNCGTSVFNIHNFSMSDIGFEGFYNEVLGTAATWNITSPGSISVTLAAVIFGGGAQFGVMNLFPGTGTIGFRYEYFNCVSLTVNPGVNLGTTYQMPVNISGAFTAVGTALNRITYDGAFNNGYFPNPPPNPIPGVITAASANVAFVTVSNSTAAGAIPFDDNNGGIDGGQNTNWLFPGYITVNDTAHLSERILTPGGPGFTFEIDVSDRTAVFDGPFFPYPVSIDAPLRFIDLKLKPLATD